MPARRKPTAELEANGALARNPGRHADRADEPAPEPGGAKPPGLSKDALKHWDAVYQILVDNRVMTNFDSFSLATLCEAYAEWRIATDLVVAYGKENVLPRILTRRDKAFDRFLKVMQDFGMTPASRSRVRAAPKPPEANKFGAMAGARRNQPESASGD